jgi:RNA polymerase sigma-70 factor (ECF subfamily)
LGRARHLRVVPAERPTERPAAESVGSISDAALVDHALEGDLWAEDVLVRRYLREVARLVARLLGSHQDVDEVVQETFLAALEGLDRLREPAAFRGWLLRIAVNQTRRCIRKRRMLRALGLDRGEPDAALSALADESLGPERMAELRAVDEVLDRLPAAQRLAWMLRYVEGHTLADISRLCSCSLATTKRRVAAAHARVLAATGEPGAADAT